MSRLNLISLLVFSFNFYYTQQITIHFEGKIYTDKNVVINGANILIIQDQFLSSSILTDVDGIYNLYLPLNHEFDITITKSGHEQKKYYVSTKGIPPEKELTKFPSYVADVVLFTHYDGIDYSLFEEPMSKYQYNPKNENIDYNGHYLKKMKLAMKELKKVEHEVVKLIKTKQLAEKKLLAKTKISHVSQENTVSICQEDNAISFQPLVSNKACSTVNYEVKTTKDNRILKLLANYKPGVTEEFIEGNGMYIIQRVLVKENEVWIYQKKVFNWGGVACFRDATSITESIFEQETKS